MPPFNPGQFVVVLPESDSPSQLWGKRGCIVRCEPNHISTAGPSRTYVFVVEFPFKIKRSWGLDHNIVGPNSYYFYNGELQDAFLAACEEAVKEN